MVSAEDIKAIAAAFENAWEPIKRQKLVLVLGIGIMTREEADTRFGERLKEIKMPNIFKPRGIDQ